MSENKAKPELSELDHSNQSYSTQRPSSSSTRYSDGSKSESNKSRPQFVVKKVGTEEVFKNLPKQNNLMGLSQINEENTADLDELLPSKAALGLKANDNPRVNIFQAEMVNTTKYKEYAKGPVYKEGNIVRHSIIGSTDIFERYERLQNKKAKENAEKAGLGVKPGKQNNASQDAGVSVSFSDRPSTRGNFLISRYNMLAQKKGAKNELKLSKDEIINEISKIKERQDVSSREQARATKNRPLSSKLYLTKDERNLEKYDKTNNHWQRTVEDISHKIKREEGAALMATSTEKFREKKELEEMLDIIQTDEERFGSKIWYHTLRKSTVRPSTAKGATSLPQATEEILQTTLVQKQLASREVIRKPGLVKTHAEANPVPERPPSRPDMDYLGRKLVERQHIIHEVQPADVADIQDLAVKGKNKLILEAEAILRQAHKKDAVRVPKSFLERKDVNKPEEIIVKGQTKSEIIRSGLNVFLT